MSERFLIDKSALSRWPQADVAEVLDPLHRRGLLGVSGAVRIEMMYSARNATDAQRLREWLDGFDHLSCPDEVWDAAIETQDKAINKGNHRALSLADLVIAGRGGLGTRCVTRPTPWSAPLRSGHVTLRSGRRNGQPR
ncbi:PIN domain-containing protein [Streptomyces lasiicapitis]|uniref:VapC toxin family PIN domain ribonuclease n=1 Tax=Streptomyces lasiicapitis TaxID=1923961 RepID=UPI003665D369